jgi:hypothetical protein
MYAEPTGVHPAVRRARGFDTGRRVNHREREGANETTALGPFYVGEHKAMPHGSDISPNLTGEKMFMQSRVTDLSGKPRATSR